MYRTIKTKEEIEKRNKKVKKEGTKDELNLVGK